MFRPGLVVLAILAPPVLGDAREPLPPRIPHVKVLSAPTEYRAQLEDGWPSDSLRHAFLDEWARRTSGECRKPVGRRCMGYMRCVHSSGEIALTVKQLPIATCAEVVAVYESLGAKVTCSYEPPPPPSLAGPAMSLADLLREVQRSRERAGLNSPPRATPP